MRVSLGSEFSVSCKLILHIDIADEVVAALLSVYVVIAVSEVSVYHKAVIRLIHESHFVLAALREVLAVA